MNRDLKSVLVTGGAGYVGNVLIPRLLGAGYDVTVYDVMYFGPKTLPLDHPNLTVIDGDIRDAVRGAMSAVEGVEKSVALLRRVIGARLTHAPAAAA